MRAKVTSVTENSEPAKRKLLFVVNVDWFFISHRLPIALEAMRQGYEVHLAVSLTDKYTELRDYGLKIHPIYLDRRSVSLWSLSRTFWHILHVYKVVKPDLVHLITIKPVLLGGLAARIAGIPAVVFAISGLGLIFVDGGLRASFRRWCVKKLYKLAFLHPNSWIIFQNSNDRLYMEKSLNLPDLNVSMVTGSGVDLSRFYSTPLPAGVPVVLLAARLLIEKGVREFYKAACILHQRGWSKKNVRFVIVGAPDAGNPHSLTQNELDNWIKTDVIEFWGWRADMAQVLKSANIVVLPSYYGEGLPKVLIEAAACGRAIVTTDHPGCRDAIKEGISGVLVPVRDANALADALEELLNDPVRTASMGRAARQLAESNFDQQQVIVDHLKIYQKIIN